MSASSVKVRKDLSADGLISVIREGFDAIPEPEQREDRDISMSDALMSAFAMFSLKDPSLLAFDERRRDPNDNFRSIYGIQHVPCDTQMRTILDPVEPETLYPLFTEIFNRVQRGKGLEAFVFFDGHYLISLDGTGYFSSSKIHCPSCQEKHQRNGKITYSHHMLGASLVHPDLKEVLPLAPEPIIKQDGDTKNDCERNATRRWLKRFRQDHPRLPVIIVEDALSSNSPHLDDLREANVHYSIGVKPGDHAFLFAHLRNADEAGLTQTLTLVDSATKIVHHFRFNNAVPLNASHADQLVNVLEYWEIHPNKVVKNIPQDGLIQYFSWITDFELTPQNVDPIMCGGRCRWKIENETFNTLKNQGYHLEHNYGHGDKNLSVVLMLILMLAFLVDQVQQRSCPLFDAAFQKRGRNKRSLWEEMRNLFHAFSFDSMAALFEAIIVGFVRQKPILNSS